jgi:methyl-accepting chemotaxis protein
VADSFRPLFDALRQTAEGVVQAMERVQKMADAALHARDEHEDLRETVHRLEGLVIQLSTEVRELRDRPSP